MTDWQFISILLDNIHNYLLLLCVSILFYYILFHKSIRSVLDPLFFSMFGSMMGSSVVLFLLYKQEISSYYFYSYVLTQLAFLLCLKFMLCVKIKSFRKVFYIDNESLFNRTFYIVAIAFDVLGHLFTYIHGGIPLFMNSRLEAFVGGSGYGIFSRVIDISRYFAVYFTVYYLINSNRTFLSKLYLLFFVVTSILSGSKSAILLVGWILYCYSLVNINLRYRLLVKRITKYFVPIAIVFVIIGMSYRTKDLVIASSELISRFVFFGDIYWNSYPNDAIKIIDPANPFYALFSDFFGSFRLVQWDQLPQPIGIEFHQYHEPSSDYLGGANARHNVFGLIYFGFVGSIFFSMIIGIVVGFFRQLMLACSKQIQIIKALSIVLFFKIISIDVDPTLTVSGLDSIIMIFPILLIVALGFYGILMRAYGSINYYR